MAEHPWEPLGVRRTIWFLARIVFTRQGIVASWRHFGHEFEIERDRTRWLPRFFFWPVVSPERET